MSLSTTKKDHAAVLHELADTAYFKRTVLVASAHNMPVESYPWRFSSVISVGSHKEEDPMRPVLQPEPTGGVLRAGRERRRRLVGGETITCTGNSFATPHIAGICALDPLEAPELTPFQLKSVLHLTATNVEDRR